MLDRLLRQTREGDADAARRLLDEALRRGDLELELLARARLPQSGGWSRIVNLLDKGHGDLAELVPAFLEHWPAARRVATRKELERILASGPQAPAPRWQPLVAALDTTLAGWELRALARLGVLGRVEHARLVCYDESSLDFVFELAQALPTMRLRELALNLAAPTSMRALFAALATQPLSTLELAQALGLEHLVGAPWLARLERFVLQRGGDGVASLPEVFAGFASPLRELVLAHVPCDWLPRALQAPRAADGLERLSAPETGLDDAQARALAGCAALGRLRTLELAGNRLGTDGAHALLTSPALGRLERIDLSYNAIKRIDLAAVEREAPHSLETINLCGNPLRPSCRSALARRQDATAAPGCVGARVAHARFGAGTVRESRDEILHVAFDDGTLRKLHERFLSIDPGARPTARPVIEFHRRSDD